MPTTRDKRAYRSARREQQAAETRQAVLDAAVLAFSSKGWGATSMRDVAQQAGVSVETVYAGFGSKCALLVAAVEVSTVGDVEPVALAARPEFLALGRGPLAARAAAAAGLVTAVHQRNAGLVRALREAAASDDEAAERLLQAEQQRRRDTRAAAEMVAGRPVSQSEADGLWAMTDAEVYRLLTTVTGWTSEQYADWLADVLARVLTRRGQR